MWRKARLDRMLVEYLLRQGYYETAMGLSETAGVGELTNSEVGTHYFRPWRPDCVWYVKSI